MRLSRRAVLQGSCGALLACDDSVHARKELHDGLGELDPSGLVPRVLKVGLTPTVDDADGRRLRSLVDYLGFKLRVQSKGIAVESYDHLAERVERSEVDLGVFSPLAYVRAQRRVPIVAIATATRRGSPTYLGYLVAKGRSARPLEELRGGRIAWVDRSSTSGYLYAKAMLLSRGLDPERFFGEQRFVGDHASAIRAVVEGEVDVAATGSVFVDHDSGSFVEGAEQLCVVSKTARIPLDCVAVHRRIQRGLARALQGALLSLVDHEAFSRNVWSSLGFDGFVRPLHDRYAEIASVQASVL